MRYFCCDDRRRNAVRDHPTLNGIDSLEVLDRDAPTQQDPTNPATSLRQRTLLVRCLKPLPPLRKVNVTLEGGTRMTNVKVLWALPAAAFAGDLSTDPTTRDIEVTPEERNFFLALPQSDRVLVVRTDSAGDFSPYQLSLVTDSTNPAPPEPFDELLATITFSFKVECPSEFDCETEPICPPDPLHQPVIDYLAKDYASFRQLLLDRLSVLIPQWQERNPADVGIALVELLAYVGDYLSYQQDATATEAYLGTARRRISIRRHARLVDYAMHDGCNARVWVQVRVGTALTLPKGTQLLTRLPELAPRIPPASVQHDRALTQSPAVFETMVATPLFPEHDRLEFYTWGNQECCLPKGATRATLRENYPNLAVGMVLIFEEVLSPKTGQPEDANPAHRHAVQLTEVRSRRTRRLPDGTEEILPLTDPLTEQPITEIAWAAEDALPFPLCLSARDAAGQYHPTVSVALGNSVLADQGRTIAPELLGTVPPPTLFRVTPPGGDRCQTPPLNPIPARFSPGLRQYPLTRAAAYRPPLRSAQATMRWNLASTLPAIALSSTLGQNTLTWQPQRDLLSSDSQAREFVVETEADGTVFLRFGDDRNGLRPTEGTQFTAVYRVGNGIEGNIGADTLAHIVSSDAGIVAIRNPLPAVGGTEPESLEDVRQRAPYAFRIQERAVTPADYSEVTERHPEVQQAATTVRWTGSWRTMFVTADRTGGLPVDAAFESTLRQHLERYRLAGHDLEIDAPRFVSLEIDLRVCVKPDYFRSQVKAALLEVFSSRTLPDGRQGVFHPDRFTFGQPVYLSSLYAIAQAVPGVDSVEVTRFRRQGIPSLVPLNTGKLELGRLEIARLENDPNFPERGVFRLRMEGGK